MLISNLAEVTLGSANIKYYEELGYKLPYAYKKGKNTVPRNSKLLVDIKHLTKGSSAIIHISCDKCGKVDDFRYDNYIYPRKNTFNGVDYNYICRECEIKEMWNRIVDKCEEKELKLLSTIDQYEDNKTVLRYVCNKHKNVGIKTINVNELLDGDGGCKSCGIENSKEKQKHSFEFINSEFDKKGYDLLETSYKNAKRHLMYRCRKHPNEIQKITYDKLAYADHGCKFCGMEKLSETLRLSLDCVAELFKNKKLELLNLYDYKNNLTKMQYICPIHRDKGIQIVTVANLQGEMFGCNYCANEYKSGENNHNWKGGISPLHNYLRYKIKEWKKDSFKKYNYRCGITRIHSNDLVIHHMYGFKLILEETLLDLNLDIRSQVNLYSDEELLKIENLLIEKHYEHGLGIPLTSYIHDLYHKIYGKGNNTKEEFDIFRNDYLNGKYKDLEKVG